MYILTMSQVNEYQSVLQVWFTGGVLNASFSETLGCKVTFMAVGPSYHTHTPLVQKLRCQTPIKYTTNISEPLQISVKYSFILPDDGSHKIRNMSE